MKRLDSLAPHTLRFASFSAAALLSFFFLSGPPCLKAGPIFSVQNLGALGSSAATVSSINSSGLATGFVTDTYGNQIPVSFSGGQANPLGGYGQANGVNAAGTIIGTSFSNNNPYVSEWSNGKTMNLGIPGYGVAINNADEVAGGYETVNGQLHAFDWSNGHLVDLGTLGGSWGSANALNSSGQLAGTSSTRSGVFNAFFSNGSTLVNLGTFGGANSYGMAINDSGEVVGSAQTSKGFLNAFVWNGGGLKDLGTLGGSQSYAYGLNNSGTVVGSSWTSGNLTMHGFIYSNGVTIDLNTLLPISSGWTIDAAYAINNAGDIVGIGTLDGKSYAVELTPECLATPEPTMLLVAGLGLLAAGKMRRQKTRQASDPSVHGMVE